MVVIIAIVILAIVLAVGAWMYSRQQRSKKLQDNFGPEYERALRQTDQNKGQAERELEERQKRVEKLNLRELRPEERSRFADAWRQTQARFVDDPKGAIKDADALIIQVMQAIGYPISDFERRADDISVTHAQDGSESRSRAGSHKGLEEGTPVQEKCRNPRAKEG
jgi:FtsZ-interacting cell division protein ZipA